MDLKQVVTGDAPDEVAEPFKALNEAFDRLFGEESNAQKPGLGLDEAETALVSAGALIEIARPVHIPGLAGVS